MQTEKAYILIYFLAILLTSCEAPRLDGHYHLVWNNNGEQFQTWNIRDNRMIINDKICLDPDSCFASMISFKGNKMTVDPWVDITFDTRYEIDENGTVTMYSDSDTLWLVPHKNCLTAENYFTNKTKYLTNSFSLLPGTMTGVAEFPKNYGNELIIGGSSSSPFYLFNDTQLIRTENGNYGIKDAKGQNVWIHVDKNITVQDVLPIVGELFEKGYLINYSTIQKSENNEQIKLMDRTIKDFNISSKQIVIDYCEFCTKYPDNSFDSIVNIEMIGVDQYSMNGDTNNLFQTRNSLVRYIIQNRTTRLSTQIQVIIDGNTKFSDYLTLLDELRFVHVETSDITYYNGKDDPDAKWIRNKQETFKSNEILDEFPMRIKEIIKVTAPNKTYK